MDRPKIFRPAVSNSTQPSDALAQPDATPQATGHVAARPPKLAWVEVRHTVDQACAQLAPQLSTACIETTVDVPSELSVLADPEMLRLAVANLVTNAVEAMPSGGRLVITSYFGQGRLELEVADSGPGLSDDARARAFEPYYSTKINAAGLGLAHVRHIAQAHGGDVVATNCPEGGAAFTLRVPAGARQAAA